MVNKRKQYGTFTVENGINLAGTRNYWAQDGSKYLNKKYEHTQKPTLKAFRQTFNPEKPRNKKSVENYGKGLW